MKMILGKETVIVQGMTAEENPWGKYQFPLPFRVGDRLLVSVHVENDTIITTGNPTRWFESLDFGETWHEVDPSVAAECGLHLPNGDRIYFPIEGGTDLSHLKFPSFSKLTPDYDFSKPPKEGEMPIQDGVTAWWTGAVIRAYRAERLPAPYCEKKWLVERIPAGETEAKREYVDVDWPSLTRVVFKSGNKYTMKPIYPRGTPMLGPDGAIWVTAFSGEGHINPKNGQYSPYYSAEIFRSTDNGKSFYQHAHMEYPANGEEYPYLSGGFSDSDIAFMDDGSMLWALRSTWMGSTGYEWAPLYMARSTDGGKNWSKPEKFSEYGVFPRFCKLACGATLLTYGRPGLFVRMTANNDGIHWSDPLEVLPDTNRNALANVQVEEPDFHQWDGACGNPELLPINENTALLFYGDFFYPDEHGVKRKSIICRTVTVVDE